MRTILHIDLDAFFCSVEELRSPELRGKAFIVGGLAEHRGVVASASYPARKFGVRSAIPTALARRLCPGLIIVPSSHGVYSQRSHEVMGRLREVTPLVEQISIDEAFLDVSDMPQSGAEIARRLQAELRDLLGLPSSFGVAGNKLVAKIASDIGKLAHQGEGPPYGLMVVPPGEESAFLAPLPVTTLWGVGPKTASRLAGLGIQTIGELAAYPAGELRRLFGIHGNEMHRRALGLDERPVETGREAKSISAETTFPRDVADGEALRRTLQELSDIVGTRLRKEGLAGSTVKLKLRWPDFTTVTRQTKLAEPTDLGDVILSASLRLFDKLWRRGKAVRLLGVGVSSLGPPARQLSLFDRTDLHASQLAHTLDALRARYGYEVLRRASTLDEDT